MNKMIQIIIDNKKVERYNDFYLFNHPRARKKPIKDPYHPSTNKWMIMNRRAMNKLKQDWKDFIVWLIDDLGYKNKMIKECEMEIVTYKKTAHSFDLDNTTIKFIQDGFVESKLLVDDNYKVVKKMILMGGYDKSNPRTEIKIIYKD